MGRAVDTDATMCCVYRQERMAPRRIGEVDAVRFWLIDSPWKAIRRWRPLLRRSGLRGLARTVAMLVARFRITYCVVEDGTIVHHGWLVVGESPLYPVGPTDVVIGPMETAPACRGRGLASFGLDNAMNAMCDQGHRVFFIHTYEGNLASRRAIAKAGFGTPIGVIPARPRP